jgi:hypothetical protein
MKRIAILICGILVTISHFALAAAAAGSTEELLKKLELRITKAAESGLEEYAKDRFESARSGIAAAKAAVAIGKEREAQQQAELAEVSLNTAEAKASEKEALEKVALRRAELKKAEALLERYRQGEVN